MNLEEVTKKIGKENLPSFEKFMRGQTVGLINGEYDYYEWDVEKFVEYLKRE